ncbi:MAG: ribonuclease P protein component [Bacteroidales bacterium]
MNSSNNTFSKEWRLKRRSEIEELFKNGRIIHSPSFKIVSLPNGISHNRAVIAVPKRSFKKAVDRNYIKRLVREGLRHSPIFKEEGEGYNLFIIYRGVSLPTLESIKIEVENGLEKSIKRDRQNFDSTATTAN